MKLLEVEQGSQQWLEARTHYFCASDASAMMGDSLYKSRDALIEEKATGIRPDTSGKDYIFAKGHQAEAGARPLAEAMLESDLFPVVGIEGNYLASFDGITFDNAVIFEHKLVSESLIEQIDQGLLHNHYIWQLEHQLLVSKAEKVLFVASDGTSENFHSLFYVSSPDRRQQLIEGWEKLKQDIEEWVSPERTDEAYQAAAEAYKTAEQQFTEANTRKEQAKQQLLTLNAGANKSSGFGVTVQRVQRKGSIDYKKIPDLSGIDLEGYRKPPSEFIKITVQEV